MAKRTKPKSPIAPIGTLEDADKALAEIAEIDRLVGDINNRLNEDIDNLKADAQEEIAPHMDRREALGAGLHNFAELNKADLFKRSKSRELDFGVIGYRKSTSLGLLKKVCSTWKEVLSKLKELALKDGIRVKEEPDKDVMSQWPPERLALVGVERVERDDFFFEVKQESLPS